jgi:CBS domain containing-hemolysin-like protein
MEITLTIVFLILGIASPFLSGIINYLSQDKLREIIETNYKEAQRLRNLKSNFDYDLNPFLIIEIVCYLLSSLFLTFYISTYYSSINLFTYYSIIFDTFLFSILIIFLRTIFQSIGISKADSLAIKFSALIWFYYILAKPFTLILNPMKVSIEGAKDAEESRDEISELVETAREEGALDPGEYRILKNIMNFSEVLVSDVMTPRTVIFSCEADKTVSKIINYPELQMYSRFPIWEGESVDDGVIGYVMSKDVLLAALKGKENTKIREFSREVYFIPESSELDTALERFLNRRQHMFVVVDEYGGVEGLLTMEDVLETILGVEILDEVDKVADLRQLAKQRRDSRIASLS